MDMSSGMGKSTMHYDESLLPAGMAGKRRQPPRLMISGGRVTASRPVARSS
jgi:hypothetical protein